MSSSLGASGKNHRSVGVRGGTRDKAVLLSKPSCHWSLSDMCNDGNDEEDDDDDEDFRQ